jgi:hypothetical protein
MSASTPALSTHVFPNIPKGYYPNHIYEKHPTLMKLIAKNEKQNGGLTYNPNRISATDGTSTWFAGTSLSAVISSASQTSALRTSSFSWTNLVTPITITYDERLRSPEGSEFTLIAMSAAKGEQAKLDHMNTMATKVMAGDGTSNVPVGLVNLVSPTATWGGISPSDDSDWAGKAITSATVLTGPSTLSDAYIPCMHDDTVPDWMPTTALLYTKLINIFGMGIQTQSKDDMEYKFGIKSLDYMTGKIVLDRDMPAGDLYMLSLADINFKQSNQFWMKKTDPKEPTDGTNIHKSLVGDITSSFILASGKRWNQGGYVSLT